MKKFIFRILAYLIDILFVNLIIFGMSNVSFINPNIKKLQDETTVYLEVTKEYNELTKKIDAILDDNYIDLSESIELNSAYPYFKDIYKGISVNREISNETKNELKDKINVYYKQYSANYYYNNNKYNLIPNIIGIIIAILYFGVFEFIMNGQTIGKKLFRLKTLDNDKPKKKIPVWKYLVKSLIVGQVIFNLASLICLIVAYFTKNVLFFGTATNIIYDVQYAFNIALVLIILFRRDERSLHDILLNIRVALFDKKNKEITKRIFNEEVSDQTN